MARYALEASQERESIRTFKSMLVCAKQFGADLFFEANEHSVTLRLLNTAQSAFLVFSLQRGFFTKYTVRTRRRHAASPRVRPTCRVSPRPLGRWRRERRRPSSCT